MEKLEKNRKMFISSYWLGLSNIVDSNLLGWMKRGLKPICWLYDIQDRLVMKVMEIDHQTEELSFNKFSFKPIFVCPYSS